jgi:hypothetical protein
LTWLVLTLTDDVTVGFNEFEVTPQGSIAGEPLPAAAEDHVLAVLDSGAATHLLSYPDSADLGIDVDWRTGNQLPVGGAGGTIDVDVSQPLGVFVHGVQDLTRQGKGQPGLMVGEGNCPVAVNTEANFLAGGTLPTAVGMPLLIFYPVEVKISDFRTVTYRDETIRTASATFYSGADDPLLPSYPHRVPLVLTPVAGGREVIWVFDFDELFESGQFIPESPAVVGAGALLQTASLNLRLAEGNNERGVRLIMDTAAQGTLISENVAIDLGLNLNEPEFEVEVQGIAGTEMAAGYHVDALHLPTGAGGLDWSDVPVIVRNLTGPEGTTVDGILGTNLIGDRDYLLNAAAASPYLELSDTRVLPSPGITAVRITADGSVEVDWLCFPAAPEIRLEMNTDPELDPAGWTEVGQGEQASIIGTVSTTKAAENAFFRVVAPLE